MLLDRITSLIGEFSYPHIEFYFPTAPLMPYTPLEGELSRVWFDQWNTTPDAPEHDESFEEMEHHMKALTEVITYSVPRLSSPWYKTVVGGFGMGGTLALHTAYYFESSTPDGVFALSSYLNDDSKVYDMDEYSLSRVPLYMCHGQNDEEVPIDWAKKTFDSLKDGGMKGEFITLKDAGHELVKEEIQGLFKWIEEILKPLPDENEPMSDECKAHMAMSYRQLGL
ncbi:unnamed protein product [Acanthoscelides obtectus]|nr:unnamed protein product [Acanthoscelides obtectus]CAK1668061.1 Lysophospholipase-like protein 1 [Acanthoscelides obtectus]